MALTLAKKQLKCIVFQILLVTGYVLLQACSSGNEPPATQKDSPLKQVKHKRALIENKSKIWPLGSSILNQATQNAKELNNQLSTLLKQPKPKNLTLAQTAWYQTASSLEQFYILSRLGIAETRFFDALLSGLFNVAAWPIQPGYLDAYGEHLYSGIIFDISAPITEVTLRDQHGFTDNEDAVLGIYAIEYLLFGEKKQRGIQDFVEISSLSIKKQEEGYQTKEELPNNRRRELLQLQSNLLIKDINKLNTAWSNNNPDSLATNFQNRTSENQNSLLTQIAQNTLTEQILAIAKQQQQAKDHKPEFNLWKSQQLSRRISSQLKGLARVMNAAPSSNLQALQPPADACANTIAQINKTDPKAEVSMNHTANWKGAYICIRNLVNMIAPNIIGRGSKDI